MDRTRKHVAALVALGVLAAGCAEEGATTKAGGDSAPVTLRLGTGEPQGRPDGNQMEEFARQVERLSDGSVKIELVWMAGRLPNGQYTPEGSEHVVAAMVQDGELDMGMIPAFTWESMGVPTLRALTAPFLVTSNELTEQVTGDEFAEDMFAGLDEIGFTGLALLPDALRHLFSFGEPILSVSDVQGESIRAPRSDATDALLEALGAIPVHPDDDDFVEGAASGEIIAAESSYVLAAGASWLPGVASTATGNLTLFPKVNSLVIDSGVFGGLSGERQEVLRDAARGARDWAISTIAQDHEAAAGFCEVGSVVLTGPAEIAAFEEAAQPVFADLEQDETTRDLIERIRELKSVLPAPTTPSPCEATNESVDSVDANASVDAVEGNTDDLAAFPDGVYRLDITRDDLRSFGVTDPNDVRINHGTITWTLEDGQAGVTQVSPDENWTGSATYTVDGDRISFEWAWAPGMPPITMTWRTVGDDLVFDVIGDWDPIIVAWYESHPWRKAG